ncbi:MAG: hypothetical protein J6S70_05190, partial [Clostridia bacterium]|nr:hypothetical protein [Clostridia bacterium]
LFAQKETRPFFLPLCARARNGRGGATIRAAVTFIAQKVRSAPKGGSKRKNNRRRFDIHYVNPEL